MLKTILEANQRKLVATIYFEGLSGKEFAYISTDLDGDLIKVVYKNEAGRSISDKGVFENGQAFFYDLIIENGLDFKKVEEDLHYNKREMIHSTTSIKINDPKLQKMLIGLAKKYYYFAGKFGIEKEK